MADSDRDPQSSHDPSRHPGRASTSTPSRSHDAVAPDDVGESEAVTKAGGLWIAFPVVCVVVLIVLLLLVFA